MADNGTIGHVQTLMCPKPGPVIPPGTPEMRAIDPVAEQAAKANRERTANTLGIALLGPVFGGPAAAARVMGAPEAVVGKMGEFGLDMAGAVALRGAGGRGRVSEPMLGREVATAPKVPAKPGAGGGKAAKPGNGAMVLKSPPKNPPGTRSADAEIKDLSQFQGKSKAQIEAELQQQGYTRVPSNDGTGSVWTKTGSDGNTAAVRLDDATVRANPKGFADEVPHAHKEVVPTSQVTNGNYGNASGKYNDSGTLMSGTAKQIAADVHIPITWP